MNIPRLHSQRKSGCMKSEGTVGYAITPSIPNGWRKRGGDKKTPACTSNRAIKSLLWYTDNKEKEIRLQIFPVANSAWFLPLNKCFEEPQGFYLQLYQALAEYLGLQK